MKVDDGVDLACAHVLHQLLDTGPLEVLAGVAGVLVDGGDLSALLGVDVNIVSAADVRLSAPGSLPISGLISTALGLVRSGKSPAMPRVGVRSFGHRHVWKKRIPC